jgi:hypothetical protein
MATSAYRFLVIKCSGDFSTLRLEFENNSNPERVISTLPYWFKDVSGEEMFVSADNRSIPIAEKDATIVVDLEKSGIDMNMFNSGLHMHAASGTNTKGSFTITEARLVKTVIIDGVPVSGIVPEPVTEPTTEPVTELTTEQNTEITTVVEKETTKATEKTTTGKTKNIKKPARAKIKNLIKKSKSKKAKITLKRTKRAKGYQIKISTSKKFKKKKTIVKFAKSTKKTIKGLKKNTKYYVKVRAYNYKTNGKRQYGKWSKVWIAKK